ncbi:MAG: hypothetical protein A3B38_04240 [Candidatus Levybacteria bacterium RIFCSPLOWO2_01_FULL_36_13]|nr:MAG: hypothetical protein A2684_01165 [Candidatus Levybacteria bacterium RIFCSPHIGHO2_01_FULL_36_15b]OGH34336.1 MAG: hypothetical protein A3B38_04240 [Candidatus Levybacteria bacterium RIFCSPLOWO2_01_FULL_36_13]
MDTAQVVLFLVIIILTVLLVVLGIQVFFILRELRKTVDRANKILEDASEITENVRKPVSSLSSLAMGLKTGATIAKIFQGDKRGKKDE